MIIHQSDIQQIALENEGLRAVVDYSKGLRIKEFSNRLSSVTSNEDKELFVLQFMGKTWTTADFKVAKVTTAKDKKEELITFLLTLEDLDVQCKIHLISDLHRTIRVLYQMYDGYVNKAPYEMYFHSPFLADFGFSGEKDRYYYPEMSVSTETGKQVLKPMREGFAISDIKLPLVVEDASHKMGFSMAFPTLSDLANEGASQNRNMQMHRIKSKEELKNHSLPLNPDASFNDTVELMITALTGGWVEAFDRFRTAWSSGYELSQYHRKDLQWMRDTLIHNFVFFYGKEGFDHRTQKIAAEDLLEQGEAFGGYDTVTFWNQYPRLGIDGRSQWDFHNDFPGGREAMKEAVDTFHAKGTKVFMPYIPWDQGYTESTDTMGTQFAQLLADTGADGYQLDTMSEIPYSFREKCDAVRPGLVLQGQMHPGKKQPVEVLTSSWNEFWYVHPMPEIDVFRFLLPCHIAPVISRWLRKEDKDLLIKRAKFSAAGIVIWQDIFGRWMPYLPEQKAELKEYKKVYFAHRDTYLCSKPIPLYPVDTPSVYCNVFPADGGEETIYSFYNDSKDVKTADVEGIEAFSSAAVILGDGTVSGDGNRFQVTVAPGDVVHVCVKESH